MNKKYMWSDSFELKLKRPVSVTDGSNINAASADFE